MLRYGVSVQSVSAVEKKNPKSLTVQAQDKTSIRWLLLNDIWLIFTVALKGQTYSLGKHQNTKAHKTQRKSHKKQKK